MDYACLRTPAPMLLNIQAVFIIPCCPFPQWTNPICAHKSRPQERSDTIRFHTSPHTNV